MNKNAKKKIKVQKLIININLRANKYVFRERTNH